MRHKHKTITCTICERPFRVLKGILAGADKGMYVCDHCRAMTNKPRNINAQTAGVGVPWMEQNEPVFVNGEMRSNICGYCGQKLWIQGVMIRNDREVEIIEKREQDISVEEEMEIKQDNEKIIRPSIDSGMIWHVECANPDCSHTFINLPSAPTTPLAWRPPWAKIQWDKHPDLVQLRATNKEMTELDFLKEYQRRWWKTWQDLKKGGGAGKGGAGKMISTPN